MKTLALIAAAAPSSPPRRRPAPTTTTAKPASTRARPSRPTASATTATPGNSQCSRSGGSRPSSVASPPWSGQPSATATSAARRRGHRPGAGCRQPPHLPPEPRPAEGLVAAGVVGMGQLRCRTPRGRHHGQNVGWQLGCQTRRGLTPWRALHDRSRLGARARSRRCRRILRAPARPPGIHKAGGAPRQHRFRQEVSRALAECARRSRPAAANPGGHVALRAGSEEAVRAFHAAALAGGGRCDGEPGPRQAAMTTYFGAFILDPDGNKLEALSFPRAGA